MTICVFETCVVGMSKTQSMEKEIDEKHRSCCRCNIS